MYDQDYEYASTRLNGTYVSLLDGTPVRIEQVYNNGMVKLYSIEPNDGRDSCHLDGINCTPLTLGYVNTPDGAAYLSRIPARKYRQGLSVNSVSIKVLGKRNDRLFNEDMLYKCVKGNYLTFKQAVDNMNTDSKPISPFAQLDGVKQPKSWAWSRRWAVCKNKSVEYRGNVVGKIVNGRVELASPYLYLKEELEESL